MMGEGLSITTWFFLSPGESELELCTKSFGAQRATFYRALTAQENCGHAADSQFSQESMAGRRVEPAQRKVPDSVLR